MDDIYLTREGSEKLKKELEYLKGTRRKELSGAVGKARLHGDLRENADYDAAKEALAMNEERVRELENKLARARIIDDKDIPKDKAFIGATVALKDLDTGEKFEYTLVSELEADFSQNKISISSPVGKSLLGAKQNAIIKVEVPAGTLRYKILKISR
jgi:transcription elongation factor GreA